MILVHAKELAARDDLLGLQAVEPRVLAMVGANARRLGDRLILDLRKGQTKTYANRPECKILSLESQCQKYVLVAHAGSRRMFVVAKLYSESVEYLLVDDETGNETLLRGFPIFSPSGNHVLVLLMNDAQIGFAVQIWRRSEHTFTLDWSGAPYADGFYTSYELMRWVTENTIELRAQTYHEPPKPNAEKKFELRNKEDEWKLVEIP